MRALEKRPPDGKDPLDWLLLTTEGEPDGENAPRVTGCYEKRWLVEGQVATVKTGTRIRDRRLNAAVDLRRCLAFDAITACTVMSVGRLAWTAVHLDEIHALAVHMAKPNYCKHLGPTDPDRPVAEFVSTPRPGTHKLKWEGHLTRSLFGKIAGPCATTHTSSQQSYIESPGARS